MPAADARVAGDPIAALLAGDYLDPVTGDLLRSEARSVVIEDSLDGAEAELLQALGLGRHLTVISDPDTHAALGARVERGLAGKFVVQSIVVGREPHADADTVARLVAMVAPTAEAIVAVGSGTLNDLCKMVALERGCPQVVFATAPSMNGYTSVSASITAGGVKRSVRAATPVGAFFDLGVIAAAPVRLVRAGLGDSACRPTAQADWLLAHLLLDTPYREVPFALLVADEAALLAEPRALVAGELPAIRHLVRTLVLSGFGMTISGGSFPASQGEHLLSHYVDMMGPADLPRTFHGEQIGVCTVTMAHLQAQLLARDAPPVLRPSTLDRAALVARFGEVAGETCWREVSPKLLDQARADELTARLARDWDHVRARISAVALGAERVTDVLMAAGAPTTAAELGWPPQLFADARAHAHEIRNRYTFLDLAAQIT